MAGAGFRPWVVELDFESKKERTIELTDVAASLEAGRFVWVDIELQDTTRARDQLAPLGLMEEDVLEDAMSGDAGTQYARYPRHLHIVMTACSMRGRDLELDRVNVVVGEQLLVTMHRGPVAFLDGVKRSYRDDFLHHARTPSFLVYEMWDHLLDSYVVAQNQLEERVEEIEIALVNNVDDRIFRDVAELSSDLLHFRKVLLPARVVLTELATRKSRFISEATQPFLANMVGTVERVLQDVLVARDIVANSVNLYMSVVGHRTNEVMRRLTIVSVIFLPLTFLVGVYGMNFDYQPELRWHYGYAGFWGLSLALVVGLILFLGRKRYL